VPSRGELPASYDAFLSYNQKADHDLAQVLYNELGRFAKPLFRTRSLRLFRDNDSLAVTPDLGREIEDALSRSTRFVLLASRRSARSGWVNREVSWWLRHRSLATLFIVVTDGVLPWEPAARTAGPRDLALPPALLPYPGEPRIVDLRNLRRTPKIDRADPVVLNAVADLYAAISGQPKDLVYGEHVRRRRRTVRLARGTVVTLSLLLVASVIATVIAVANGNRAVAQARVATARQIAALAVSNIDNRMDVAQLLAVAAYRMDDSPQTRAALHQVTMASPHLVRYEQMGDRVLSLAAARSGQYVFAGTAGGTLVRWDVTSDAKETVDLDTTAILSVAVNDLGDTAVAASASKVDVWRAGQPVVHIPVRPSEFVREMKRIAISPSGDTVAALEPTSDWREQTIRVFSASTGEEVTHVRDDDADSIGLPSDDEMMVGIDGGEWRTVSVPSGDEMAHGGDTMTPADAQGCCAFGRDNGYFVWAKFGVANVVKLGPDAEEKQSTETTVPVDDPDVYAVDDLAQRVALAGGGELYVADVPDYDTLASYQRLPGVGDVDAMTFVGSPDRLVSASGTSLILWDLTQPSRAVRASPVAAPSTPEAPDPPNIAVGPRVVVANSEGIVVLQRPESPYASVPVHASVADPMPVWSADGEKLIVLGDNGQGGGAAVVDKYGDEQFWPEPSTRDSSYLPPAVLAARLAPGRRLVSVNEHGDIQVRNADTGRVLKNISSGLDTELAPSVSVYQNAAAISEDGSTAAIILPGQQKVRITDVRGGDSHELPGPASVVAFVADRLLVAKANNDLEVWDAEGTQRLRTITGDAGYAQAITGVPKSRLVARLTNQGIVKLWYIDSGRLLGSFPLPESGSSGAYPWSATSLAATPDGTELISATAGGVVVRWDLRPEGWVDASCRAAARSLSPAEWAEYVGDAAVPAGTC
jgi:WD40 repeat protein